MMVMCQCLRHRSIRFGESVMVVMMVMHVVVLMVGDVYMAVIHRYLITLLLRWLAD